MLRCFWLLMAGVLIWVIIALPVCGQEFENLDRSYKDKDPAYAMRLSLEYLDNERDTEETGYYDLKQRKIQKEGHGNLKLYFFNLDAHYKSYDTEIRIGDDKTSLFSVRDNIGARAEFLEYVYLFGQIRNLHWKYTHADDGTRDFHETEKASATLQGVGVVLDSWRFGLSPGTDYTWSYRVRIESESVIDEEIAFEIRVWELAKRAIDTEGPFYELGLRQWNDTAVNDHRDGSLERSEAFVMLGMGFSENTIVFLGGKASSGKIESRLLADNSEARRQSSYTNNVIGLRLGIGEESSIYAEQRFLTRTIDFDNTAYENTQQYAEEKLTLGLELNEQFSFELKFGKTRIEKDTIERAVNYRAYQYRQTDNLVGISVNMRFSE